MIKRVFLMVVILIFPLVVFGSGLVENNSVAKIGIISALNFESSYLKSQIKNLKTENFFNREFYTGEIDGMDVVVATVGIGIVNASVGTAIMIEKYSPSVIILTGVAGGTKASTPGNTVICSGTTFYDLGMLEESGKFIRLSAFDPQSNFNATGDEPLNFIPEKFLFDAAMKAGKHSRLNNLVYKGKTYKSIINSGIISTTETFMNTTELEKEHEITKCLITDMEAAGPAQVCYQQKVPFLTIKSVSDSGSFDMYNALKDISAKNAEIVVLNTIKELKKLNTK